MFLAETVRGALAASVLRLYTALTGPLGSSTVLASFTEATFSGYVAKTIANFLPPYIDPLGGASIQTGTQQFNWETPGVGAPVVETVLGFYLEDSTGVLIIAGTFDGPVAMAAVGDAIPMNLTLNYGRA